jgi:hypothetical protein
VRNELLTKIKLVAADEKEYKELVALSLGGGVAAAGRDLEESKTRIQTKIAVLSDLIHEYAQKKQAVAYNASGRSPWLVFRVPTNYEALCTADVVDVGCAECNK